MKSSKEIKRAAVAREFMESKTMTVAQYNAQIEAIDAERDDEPVAPPEPDITQVVEATRRALETVSANLSPLMQRVTAIEKQMKSRDATETGSGLSINASEIKIDLGELAQAIITLNQKLSQPVVPVYDAAGKLIGAERRPRLDS